MNKLRDGKPDFVKIAHRGASAYEPENTMRSFKRALEMGADMLEFDVRLSRDGQLVVMHDEHLDRTTDGRGLARERTLAELKTLNAGGGETIPTPEEVIGLAKGSAGFVVELKEQGTERGIINLLRKNDLFSEAFVVSFHRSFLMNVKELEPQIRTGLILFSSPDPIRAAKGCHADAVAPYHDSVTAEMVEKAHDGGLILITWTVDDRQRAEYLRGVGVDGIVTNKPDLW